MHAFYNSIIYVKIPFFYPGTISRKRGRESTTTTPTTTPNTIYPFTFQSESPQFIDLTQLHNHHHHQNHNTVSTGLGLSFGHQQQHQQHEYQSSHFLSLMSQGIASQIKQQRDEIDQIIQSQVKFFIFNFISSFSFSFNWNFSYFNSEWKKKCIGRRTETGNSGKKAETLSSNFEGNKWNGVAAVKRKGNGNRKSDAQEHRVRSTRGRSKSGGAGVASKS